MDKNKKISKILLLLVSIQTIIMGILFIVQILRIYFLNNKVFTSEICLRYILQILPVIIIWIILIVLSYIYFKKSNSKDNDKSKLTKMGVLKLYDYMCPKQNGDELDELYASLKKENKKRNIALIINIVIIMICSLMGLMYLLNVKHFDSQGDLTLQAIQMTIHLIPWVIISFISSIIYLIYIEKSASVSIDVIKTIISLKGKNIVNYDMPNKKNTKLLVVRLAIIGVALCLIIHGIINGGASDVLQKAVNICTECIGLG